MSVSMNRIFGLVAIAGLACACVSQAAVQAKFHLPVAAHWGKALLAPGDYTIRVSTDLGSGQNQLLIVGAGCTLREVPVATDLLDSSDKGSLQLVAVGNDYFVREYRSGIAAKTFTFELPKRAASGRTKVVEIAN